MASRVVRFHTLVPAKEGLSPVPLFSPTQIPSYRHVLHSIFSPSPSMGDQRSVAPPASQSRSPAVQVTLQPKVEDNAHVGQRLERMASPDSSNPSEIFFSPAQTATSSLGSPFSFLSKHTAASIKSLPHMSMLSLEFIRQCQSVTDLQRVINILDQDGSFPSLLRAARERLHEMGPSSSTMPLLRCLTDDDPASEGGSSSVVMSLSSDGESVLVALHSPYPRAEKPVVTNVLPLLGESDRVLGLQKEINRLTQAIVEMETQRMLDQKEYLQKLRQVEDSKHHAQETIRTLESLVSHSNSTTHDLMEALDEIRKENRRLKRHLDQERAVWEEKRRQADKMEQRLTKEAEELRARLNQCETQMKDRTLQRKTHALSQLLGNAERNLDQVKRERDEIIQIMATASQAGEIDVKKLTVEDRQKLIAEFSKKAAASKTALNAMAKALSESEGKRQDTAKKYRESQRQLSECTEKMRQLELENQQMAQKIQALSQDLVASRAYAENLLHSAQQQQTSEWESREKMYKNIIHELKKRLRSKGTMIPIALYKAAVTDAKTQEAQAARHRSDASRLAAEVARLESQLREKENTRPPLDSERRTLTKTLPSIEKAVSTERLMSLAIQPVTPRDAETGPRPAPVERPQLRVAMVRAAGGRKGLREKLQKMRSPRALEAPLQAHNW